ncbi:hypothetical protein JCM19379_24150 [Methyloparacoccus murrellii]
MVATLCEKAPSLDLSPSEPAQGLLGKSASPKLAKVSVDDMNRHVPAGSGSGNWESVAIPFAAFAPQFQSISLTL